MVFVFLGAESVAGEDTGDMGAMAVEVELIGGDVAVEGGGDEVLPEDDAAGGAGGIGEVDMVIDATIEDGDADAGAVETEVVGNAGADGGVGVLESREDFAIGGDVFDAGVTGEGGEGASREAGGEAVDEGEFADGPGGCEV